MKSHHTFSTEHIFVKIILDFTAGWKHSFTFDRNILFSLCSPPPPARFVPMTPSLLPSAQVALWFCRDSSRSDSSSSQAPQSFNLSLTSGPIALPRVVTVQLHHRVRCNPVLAREDWAKDWRDWDKSFYETACTNRLAWSQVTHMLFWVFFPQVV